MKPDSSSVQTIFNDISRVAEMLWQKGWAERNAGNISVDVTSAGSFERPASTVRQELTLTRPYASLGGRSFLVTLSGSRMRDVARDPHRTLCLLTLSESGDSGVVSIDGSTDGSALPTSELESHLAIHNRLRAIGSPHHTVVHTHPIEPIVLSHDPRFCNEAALNRILFSMQPETVIVLPRGVGFIPYLMTGSSELADETATAIEHHDVVVWEKHGILAVGATAEEAFDKIDVIVKTMRIYLDCRTAGFEPQGIDERDIEALRKNFV